MLVAVVLYKYRGRSLSLQEFRGKRGWRVRGRVPRVQASLDKNIAFSAIGIRAMAVYSDLAIYLYSDGNGEGGDEL